MLERLRLAWGEFWSVLWSGEEDTTVYTLARHAAEARLASEWVPAPDRDLMERIKHGKAPRFYRRAV
jgi:hypothetical protein